MKKTNTNMNNHSAGLRRSSEEKRIYPAPADLSKEELSRHLQYDHKDDFIAPHWVANFRNWFFNRPVSRLDERSLWHYHKDLHARNSTHRHSLGEPKNVEDGTRQGSVLDEMNKKIKNSKKRAPKTWLKRYAHEATENDLALPRPKTDRDIAQHIFQHHVDQSFREDPELRNHVQYLLNYAQNVRAGGHPFDYVDSTGIVVDPQNPLEAEHDWYHLRTDHMQILHHHPEEK